jgi:hypothetical protein
LPKPTNNKVREYYNGALSWKRAGATMMLIFVGTLGLSIAITVCYQYLFVY